MPTNQQLAMIHIAKKALNLSDENYQAMLSCNFKVESSRYLNEAEAHRLIAMFRGLGWKQKMTGDRRRVTGDGKPRKKYDELGKRPGMASPAQLRLLEMTWMTNPNVQSKTTEALRRFLEHRFKISALQFVEDRDVGKVLLAIQSIRKALNHEIHERHENK